MTFNLETWRERATEKLQQIGYWVQQRRQDDLPYVLYGTVAGLSLWPLVETAVRTGQLAPVIATLYGTAAGVGTNLIATQIEAWKNQATPPTEAEVSRWVAQQAPADAELRQTLDAILQELDAFSTAQATLPPKAHETFRQMLRTELEQIGNADHFEAFLSGRGAIAQGVGSTALGERAVQNEEAEIIITGDNNSVRTIIHHYGAGETQLPDPDALHRQIGQYLTWLLDWAGTLELRGIQRQGEQVVQLPLEQVYVPLAATAYRSPNTQQGEEDPRRAEMEAAADMREQDVSLTEILSLERRLILTGGPGSGKTTVLLHVAWALARALADDDPATAQANVGFPPDEALPLPIYVPLSAYAAHCRDLAGHDDRTLATFISRYLFARQTSFDLPDDFFPQLLRRGQAVLLLLDGLDEVPDDTERAGVRQAIEDLVTGRDEMRVVVTCRTAAYQGRTALGKGFRQVVVKPLGEDHIAALVEHAYAHLYRHDALLRQQKTEALLAGITQLEAERQKRLGEKAARLIDSPLLVRMLLVVHYRERRLPEQRAELYMKATDAMLLPDYAPDVEMADAIGELVGGSWEVHRDLVQHLAFHMHSRGDNKQGREILEDELRRLLEAEPAYAPLVDDFIKLTRLRGTLLEERLGSYRFLHLAFQEYLAARYLAEVKRSEGGVAAIVSFLEEAPPGKSPSSQAPLLDSWWREVVLLVVGYFAVNNPATAQTFLERLAGIDQQAAARPPLSPDLQLAGAELAAVGWLEWPAQREGLRQALAARLATLFADEGVMDAAATTVRAGAGRALAQVGDPRPGVGVVERDGVTLPDIAWSEEIPAGTYTIGGKYGFDVGEISIDRPYRLARYPITNAQFQAFLDAPDRDRREWWEGLPEDERQFSEPEWSYANHPRDRVSWYQALAFCRWLTAKLHAGALPAGPLAGDLTQYTITLPHEYEWEVATRWPNEDVQERIYPWGPEFDATKANTNEGNNVGQTTAVGMYPSGRNRALDLYDLSGNVWEWCRNRRDAPEKDVAPEQVNTGDAWRVLRGGSFNANRARARAAYRYNPTPVNRNLDYGFRVACVARRPPSHQHDH